MVASKQVSTVPLLQVLQRGHCVWTCPLKRGGCFKRGHSIRTCPLARGVCITSKLNHSLDRSNYQILLCDLSVQIICVPITTQDIQFLSVFLVFFFALLVWFIVVVGTNIVNHYRFIPPIGNPDRNHKLWNIESTERYISRHCWNVATYKWKVHTGKIEIMSFVVVFLTAPHSISSHRSSYEADLSVSVVSFISTSMG